MVSVSVLLRAPARPPWSAVPRASPGVKPQQHPPSPGPPDPPQRLRGFAKGTRSPLLRAGTAAAASSSSSSASLGIGLGPSARNQETFNECPRTREGTGGVLGTQRGTLGHREWILRSPVLREMLFRWPRAARSLLDCAWLGTGSRAESCQQAETWVRTRALAQAGL